MITELMLLLIAVGAGIIFVAWTNSRRRKQDALERREVVESTGKLKQELERTANEIIGRMENHVTHLEKVIDDSERNRTQLEGRVVELKKLLHKSEGQSGEIRDLLARLDDAGTEINAMQRKMDAVERKLNLAMTTPLPMQQPVAMPPMPQPIMQPVAPPIPKVPVTQVTTPPAPPMNPLGPITAPQIIRPPKVDADKPFDKVLEESLTEPPKPEVKTPRTSIVLSPENKQPMKVVDADPVKIEATRKRLSEASAKLAETLPAEERPPTPPPQRKRDVRRAALDAIKAAEQNTPPEKPLEEPRKKPSPEILPERRDLKLETTDSAVIKEMLLSGMTVEEIARETGLGRGAIELVQEMTRRKLNRK